MQASNSPSMTYAAVARDGRAAVQQDADVVAVAGRIADVTVRDREIRDAIAIEVAYCESTWNLAAVEIDRRRERTTARAEEQREIVKDVHDHHVRLPILV